MEWPESFLPKSFLLYYSIKSPHRLKLLLNSIDTGCNCESSHWHSGTSATVTRTAWLVSQLTLRPWLDAIMMIQWSWSSGRVSGSSARPRSHGHYQDNRFRLEKFNHNFSFDPVPVGFSSGRSAAESLVQTWRPCVVSCARACQAEPPRQASVSYGGHWAGPGQPRASGSGSQPPPAGPSGLRP